MALSLYTAPASGHAHVVRNFLSMLELDYEPIEVDALTGAARTAEYRRLNPFCQIPVLDHDGFVVRDSHAILVYLAKTYDPGGRWLPEDPRAAARVQEWLATSTLELVLGPARARAATQFARPFDIPAAQKQAHRLFGIMDAHLSERPWLAMPHPTIADLSCYTYAAMSEQGGIGHQEYPHLQAWLRGIEALPGFVPAPAPPY